MPSSILLELSSRTARDLCCSQHLNPAIPRGARKNKGPTPFGIEPCLSDFVMLPLFVHNVSIVIVQFLPRVF